MLFVLVVLVAGSCGDSSGGDGSEAGEPLACTGAPPPCFFADRTGRLSGKWCSDASDATATCSAGHWTCPAQHFLEADCDCFQPPPGPGPCVCEAPVNEWRCAPDGGADGP